MARGFRASGKIGVDVREPGDQALAEAVRYPAELVAERNDADYTLRMKIATSVDRAAAGSLFATLIDALLKEIEADLLAATGSTPTGTTIMDTKQRWKIGTVLENPRFPGVLREIVADFGTGYDWKYPEFGENTPDGQVNLFKSEWSNDPGIAMGLAPTS